MRDILETIGMVVAILAGVAIIIGSVALAVNVTSCPDGTVKVRQPAVGCVPWEAVYGNP